MDNHKTSVCVETWLSKIPGISTYRNLESRRETDKHLREHLASRLQEAREYLKRIALDLSRKGQIESLDELDWLTSHIQQVADMIRYASYGYSGIFDLNDKIGEDELDQLYFFDLSLMDEIEMIHSMLEALDTRVKDAVWKENIRCAQKSLYRLEEKFQKRMDFMAHPH